MLTQALRSNFHFTRTNSHSGRERVDAPTEKSNQAQATNEAKNEWKYTQWKLSDNRSDSATMTWRQTHIFKKTAGEVENLEVTLLKATLILNIHHSELN